MICMHWEYWEGGQKDYLCIYFFLQLGDLPSSEAICSALGELERGEEESVLEAINPALSPPTSSSTIIADVPTFPSISSQPLQSAGLSAGIASSYATTTNVPQLSSAIPQLSSDVPPLSSGISSDVRLEDIELMIDTNYSGDLRPSVESAIHRKWSRVVGAEFDIVVSKGSVVWREVEDCLVDVPFYLQLDHSHHYNFFLSDQLHLAY